MAKVLTTRTIEAMRPDPAKRIELPDGGLPGLYLVVQPSGAKSWATRYRYNGTSRKATLGRYPALGLADARTKAREMLAAVSTGDDPALPRQVRRETVADLARDYMRRHGSKIRSHELYQRIIDNELLPRFGSRLAEHIKRRDLIEMIDEVSDRAPAMARLTFAVVRGMFSWAVSRDLIATSPCHGIKPPAAGPGRDRVLADAEIKALWQVAGEMGWPHGNIVKLLLLTGCRRQEVTAMTWSEVDGSTWMIPASRAKNGRAHQVHLTDPALLVLASVPRIAGVDLVFSNAGRQIGNRSEVQKLLRARMAEIMRAEVAPFVVHDIRRAVATNMPRCGVDLVVAEKLLNHAGGQISGIAAIYNRHSYEAEMKSAWQAWAALLGEITGDTNTGVVPFRGAE